MAGGGRPADHRRRGRRPGSTARTRGHHRGPGGRRRLERADRVEPDGGLVDVPVPQARRAAAATRSRGRRVQGDELVDGQRLAGRRVGEAGERALDALDAVDAPRAARRARRGRGRRPRTSAIAGDVDEDDDRRGRAGLEVVLDRDGRLAALEARRQHEGVGDALHEPEERGAGEQQQRRASGRGRGRGGASPSVAIRSQRDRRGRVGLLARWAAQRASDAVDQAARRDSALTRGPSMPRSAGQERQAKNRDASTVSIAADAERAQGRGANTSRPPARWRPRSPRT